ncbi:MAG TPA: thioredoxin family protein [Candidatus Acidoferrum sp.]|nr:thioredoxin family protein [Candidatus Acidoferrum sp.]
MSTAAALASEHLTTDIVMVNLFPYLAVRYQASDVPTTVADGRTIVVGSVPEESYVEAIVRAAG